MCRKIEMRLRKCGNYLASHILKSYNECGNEFKTMIIHANCLIIRENTKICKAFYKVQSVKNSDRMRYKLPARTGSAQDGNTFLELRYS